MLAVFIRGCGMLDMSKLFMDYVYVALRTLIDGMCAIRVVDAADESDILLAHIHALLCAIQVILDRDCTSHFVHLKHLRCVPHVLLGTRFLPEDLHSASRYY